MNSVTCDRLNPAKAVSFGASCEAVINLKGRMRSGKRERSYVGFHTATAESEAGKQPSEAVNTAVFPLRFRFASRLRAVIGPLCFGVCLNRLRLFRVSPIRLRVEF